MTEPVGHRERRPWTEEEDRLLRLGIEREDPGANPPTKWHAIANHVPNRTNKDCRKRWWAQMATTVAKGGWSADEDERLCNAVEEFGTKWALVAKHVQTRNSGQCAKRWNDALNPAIDRSEWTEEEDIALIEAVKVQGKSWTNIVRAHLPGRTGLAAKNRYNHLTRATSDRTKNRERRTSSAAAPYSATRTASIVPPSSTSTDSTPPRSSRDGSPTGSYHSPYPHPGGMPLKKEESNYALGYARDPRRDTLSLTHPPDAYAPHLGGMPPGGPSNGMYPPPLPSQYPYPQQPPISSPSYPNGQAQGPGGGPGYFQGSQGSYHNGAYTQPPLGSSSDQHPAQYSTQHYLPPPQYGRYGPGYDSAHPPGTKALDGYSRAQPGGQHQLPPPGSGYEHRQPAYDGQQTPTQQPVKQEVAAGMVNQQMW